MSSYRGMTPVLYFTEETRKGCDSPRMYLTEKAKNRCDSGRPYCCTGEIKECFALDIGRRVVLKGNQVQEAQRLSKKTRKIKFGQYNTAVLHRVSSFCTHCRPTV